MPFPLSLNRCTQVQVTGDPEQYVEPVLTAISDWLKHKRARRIVRSAHSVSFSAGIFRLVTGLNPLGPIGSGSIAVSPDADGIDICYSFRFTELFVTVTVMVAAFFGPPMWRAPNLDEFDAISLLGILWLWLFGGNYAITSFRVPRLLRKVAREAIDSAAGGAST
jgi:hypothetical protein